jgi:hypothetical protein
MKSRDPSASAMTRQATPRRAAALIASATRPPFSSSSQM